jgi:NADPH:quinone reductase
VRAAICAEYGAPNVVTIGDIADPQPAPHEVRVRVHAAAVNFPDVLLVANRYQVQLPTPFVPGSEYSGTIDALGTAVDGWSVGDRVFGTAISGAFAEFAVTSPTMLTRVPDAIGFRAAAAFGVAYRTAYHSLRSVASVQPGEVVIALGAGGGVGLATVQLGVALGAEVAAIASSDAKLAVARLHGASTTICHRDADLREALPHGADVVVDPVGGDLAEPALRALRPGGRFVTVGYAAGSIPKIPLNLVMLKGVTILGFQFLDFATRCGDDLARNDAALLELFSTGGVRPHIGATFPLVQTAAALELVASGGAIGKVIIDVATNR